MDGGRTFRRLFRLERGAAGVEQDVETELACADRVPSGHDVPPIGLTIARLVCARANGASGRSLRN